MNNYYAIIPATVRYNKKITANVKLLYAEITSPTNTKGFCWASNRYFADFFDVDSRTIQRWLQVLAKEKYISIKVDRDKKTNSVISRSITLLNILPPPDRNVVTPPDRNVVTPPDRNVVYNNIRVNNKRNIKEKSTNDSEIISRNYTIEEINQAFVGLQSLDEF